MKPDRIIVIGASTGGPKALVDLFSELTIELKTPIVVAVHAPIDIADAIASGLKRKMESNPLMETFRGKPLNDSIRGKPLSSKNQASYKTAIHNEDIQGGTVYFSPGKKHTFVTMDFMRSYLRISDEPSMTTFKPSVDLLFLSAANSFKSKVLGIIMTGLSTGRDGVEGCKKIKEYGGVVVVQDKRTSDCFGMPKNIIDAGLADSVLPLKLIANKMKMFQ
ncbi:MAG: chemotaxis protein CheB [Nitrospinae bacterium]|nr:chemotaxis protein CheB [Nitrospinota bacterium]